MLHRRPDDWKHQPQSLEGKLAVVSGGSTGIGRATVRLLAAEGAQVLTFARHEKELTDALADTRGLPGKVHPLVADQARMDDLQRVFEEADRLLGGVDILINNAALGAGSILEMDSADMQYILNVNIMGYLTASKLAAERMTKRDGGHIVNVGSMSADVREGPSNFYVATKAAIQGFSEGLRKEVNEKGIHVSLIEPGQVGSDMQDTTPRQERKQQEKGEALAAEDIAECVYYCLTQPQRCDVVSVQIRPHLQAI